MAVIDRVKIRLGDVDDSLVEELVNTVSDRLCIRLGSDKLPTMFESICVDATVKAYRRLYYEGISSEGVANISTSFFEDILYEYEKEINAYVNSDANSNTNGKVVHFL